MTANFELRVRLPLVAFEVDLDVSSSARALGIFGPSGAGKTSLLEAIAGWRSPSSGLIRIGDALFFDSKARVEMPIESRGVGYVPQDALLFPHWNVRRNLLAGANASESRELFDRTLAILELSPLVERSSTELSGGERQRVALGRAILSRPRVLLLDEPLGALDLPLRRRILPYLIRIRAEFELPTIFVSHDATEVQVLCDEVVVLERGRASARGRPSEILRYARPGERAFDNVLAGRVAERRGDTARVELEAGGEVFVPGAELAVGARTVFALGSDEILLALAAPQQISARNVVAATIDDLVTGEHGGVRVDATLDRGRGARISASLTRASVDELALAPGREVYLIFKTNSCRVLSTAN